MAKKEAKNNSGSQPKNKKKRDQARNKGLDKRFFSKVKQEYHDIDYADQLSAEEKDWLSRFQEEDLGANFKHKDGGEVIYKEHKDRLKSYNRNNARNRDIYGLKKAAGMITDVDPKRAIEQRQEASYDDGSYEDALIAEIDAKKED